MVVLGICFHLKVHTEDEIFHPNYCTNDNVLCALSECHGAQHPAGIQFIAAALPIFTLCKMWNAVYLLYLWRVLRCIICL